MISFPASALAVCLACSALAPNAAAQIHPLARAIDRNPDPRIVETVLIAAVQHVQLVPGKKTSMMIYSGSFPGPTIEANVGDKVIVHLINMLPEPTTIHWHGVETPAHMDGTVLSQAPVPSSGHFRYEFVANCAGTFWYHPHTNTNEQVEKGLYGALIVRDPRHDENLGIPRDREHVLFLDDIKLDKNNQLAPFSTDPRSEFIPWARAEDLVNSRVGTHLLINGQLVTPATLQSLAVESGLAYRFRILSVSSGNLWRLSIPDQNAKWYGIGSDQGLWNAPELIPPIGQIKDFRGHHDLDISNIDPRVGVTLTPSDRIETVLVPHGETGAELFLEAHDFIKGKHIAFRDPDGGISFGHDHFDGAEKPMPILRFKISAGATSKPYTPPAKLRWDPCQKLVVDLAKPPLPVMFGHSLPNRETGDVMFFLNVDKSTELLAAVRDKKVVLPIDYGPLPMMKLRAADGYHVKVGEARYWEVVNFTGSDHNFHVHGFPFQHIETEYFDKDEPRNNRKEQPLRMAYEDTIQVPKRPGIVLGRSYTVMRFAVRFDDAHRPEALRRRVSDLVAGGMAPGFRASGGWLTHCHFLEHGSKGMMSFISVTR